MDPLLGKTSEFLLDLYREARVLGPESFQRTALRELGRLVPYDFAAWGGGQADDRQVTDVVVLDQSVELLTKWPEVGPLDPFCDLTLLHLNRTWRFDDVPAYRDCLAYNEHWRTFGVRHMMSTIMAEPIDGYVSFIGLCNADRRLAFDDGARRLKQMLMPHLSEALRLNREHYLDKTSGEEEGTAIVNRAGWILASNTSFKSLAREEWGGVGRSIPQGILNIEGDSGSWRGSRIQLRLRRVHHYFLLRARQRSGLDELSKRELQVAELFARGLSHKEVAHGLDISPATVRNHIARIYEKLGIGTKAELAGLF